MGFNRGCESIAQSPCGRAFRPVISARLMSKLRVYCSYSNRNSPAFAELEIHGYLASSPAPGLVDVRCTLGLLGKMLQEIQIDQLSYADRLQLAWAIV